MTEASTAERNIDNSSGNKPDLLLIDTGSELEIAEKAADELRKQGRTVRVVSLVCWELFEEQTEKYKEVFSQVRLLLGLALRLGSHLDEARIFSIAFIYLLILVSKQF